MCNPEAEREAESQVWLRFRCGLPFQIRVAESHFVKPLVKISKTGSHPLMDDCPINWKLPFPFNNSSADQDDGKDNGEKQEHKPKRT